MLESGKISPKQLILLLFISRLSLTLTYFRALISPPKNQDVWLSAIVFIPIALLFSFPIYLLAKRFPRQSIIEYSQTLMGCFGKLIGLLYFWLFLHIASLSTSQFSLFFTSVIMPETPLLFFIVTLVLLSAYIVRNGLEVMSRLSEFSAPIIMVGTIITSLLLLNDFDFQNLSPIIEAGFLPIFEGGFLAAMRTFEIVALAMLLPYLNQTQKNKKVFLLSYSLMSIYFLWILLPAILVIGYEHAKEHLFLYFDTIRLISIGDFLERLEATLIIIWSLAIFARIPLYYYLATLSVSQIFNLRDYKPLVLPIGALIISLTLLIGPSLPELSEFLSGKVFRRYALFYIFFIPLFLSLIAWIRNKRSSNNA